MKAITDELIDDEFKGSIGETEDVAIKALIKLVYEHKIKTEIAAQAISSIIVTHVLDSSLTGPK